MGGVDYNSCRLNDRTASRSRDYGLFDNSLEFFYFLESRERWALPAAPVPAVVAPRIAPAEGKKQDGVAEQGAEQDRASAASARSGRALQGAERTETHTAPSNSLPPGEYARQTEIEKLPLGACSEFKAFVCQIPCDGDGYPAHPHRHRPASESYLPLESEPQEMHERDYEKDQAGDN